MTPTESKSSNNTNRVRCFNREALVPTVCDNKWSLVKILCTQPFNKHVPYGLSFIKVYINDNGKKSPISMQKDLLSAQFLNKTSQVIGILKFREDSPDSESEKSSSLFNRWKKSKKNDIEQTAAASIRMALKTPTSLMSRRLSDVQKSQTSQSAKADDSILDRNRDKLLFGDDNDEDTNNENQKKLERLSEQIEADKERRRIEKEKEVNKNNMRKSLDVKRSVEPQKSGDQQTTKPPSERVKKRQSSPPENPMKKIKTSKKFRPFNQLLKDVVLVISGIQNPDRGDLRNKAIALGAKYKADWDSTCTHLICAFKNTPKYNQVKGKGKIVTRNWIEKCYNTKKYLPWRRYALESIEVSKPESDEEIFEDTQKHESDDSSPRKYIEEESEDRNNTLALYDIDQFKTNSFTVNNNRSSSESDTDDEIIRIKQKTNTVQKVNAATKTLDIYEASTDEEDYTKGKRCQK